MRTLIIFCRSDGVGGNRPKCDTREQHASRVLMYDHGKLTKQCTKYKFKKNEKNYIHKKMINMK